MSEVRTATAPSPLFPHPDGRAVASRCAAAAREVNAGCVVLVPPPALQPDPQLTLPLDINDYPMAKYVRGHFQVRCAPRPGSGELFPTGRQLLGCPWHPGHGVAVRFRVPAVAPRTVTPGSHPGDTTGSKRGWIRGGCGAVGSWLPPPSLPVGSCRLQRPGGPR